MFFLGILVNDQLDKTYLYYQYSKAETFFFHNLTTLSRGNRLQYYVPAQIAGRNRPLIEVWETITCKSQEYRALTLVDKI